MSRNVKNKTNLQECMELSNMLFSFSACDWNPVAPPSLPLVGFVLANLVVKNYEIKRWSPGSPAANRICDSLLRKPIVICQGVQLRHQLLHGSYPDFFFFFSRVFFWMRTLNIAIPQAVYSDTDQLKVLSPIGYLCMCSKEARL